MLYHMTRVRLLPRSSGALFVIFAVLLVLGGCGSSGEQQGVGIPPDPDEGDHDPGGPKPLIASLNLYSGPVGSEVTLSGSGFSPSAVQNHVEFQGVRATVLASASDHLITVVPEGAVSGFVTVTVKGNISNGVFFVVTSLINTSRVTSVCPSEDGDVWVGTRGGLVSLDLNDGSYTRLSVTDGLRSDYIIDLIPFSDSYLILTNKGLQRFNGDSEDPEFEAVCPEITFSGYGRILDKMISTGDSEAFLARKREEYEKK